nr:MAG TPA: hypothetical protein [Caudoviricetes sp.]
MLNTNDFKLISLYVSAILHPYTITIFMLIVKHLLKFFHQGLLNNNITER